MKKLFFAFVSFLLILLTSCNFSNLKLGAVSVKTDHLISEKYSKFNGEESHSFTIKDESKLVFTVSVKTTDGKLTITITQDGEDVFTKEYTEIGEYSDDITAPNTGTYKVKATAENHKGSYSIVW